MPEKALLETMWDSDPLDINPVFFVDGPGSTFVDSPTFTGDGDVDPSLLKLPEGIREVAIREFPSRRNSY